MKNEINLIPQKKKLSSKASQDIKLLRYLTIGALLIVTSLSVGIFLITSFSPLPALQKEEQQAAQELDSLRVKAVKYLTIQKRLQDLKLLYASREKYPEVLENMQLTQPQDVTFTTISLSQKQVTMYVSSPSLLALNDVIAHIVSESEKKQLYKNMVISNIEYKNTDSAYNAALMVELP